MCVLYTYVSDFKLKKSFNFIIADFAALISTKVDIKETKIEMLHCAVPYT